MKVALVNPFDPLPGEAVREGRYASFARALAAAGHQVAWYSSDFSHTLKRPRDARAIGDACAAAGFHAELVPTPPYDRNVGLARLASHRLLAKRTAERMEGEEPFPDVVLVSTPPPVLAAAVAGLARRLGAKVALDVQDLWPEAFSLLVPAGLRWAARLAGWPMMRDMVRAERGADLGIGVAEQYRRHFQAHAPPATPSRVLHLGVNLAEFDRLAACLPAVAGPAPGLPAVAGKRWILAGGMVGFTLDWPFLLALAGRLQQRLPDVHILLAGTGPAQAPLRQQFAERRLGNVHLLGYQPYPAFCALAARADFGLSHFRGDSRVYFPNRVFDYFAADLPVLSTIPGELAEVLAAHQAGFTTGNFDADATVAYVERTLPGRPPLDNRPEPRLRRGSWVERFDRPAIARRAAAILQALAAGGEILP